MPIIGTIASSFRSGVGVVDAYESIQTTTVTGTAQEMGFTSIPQTYRHLQIRGIIRSTYSGSTEAAYYLRINGSLIASSHWLFGNGSGPGAINPTNGYVGTAPAGSSPANVYAPFIIDILDYADTNKNKIMRILTGFDQNGSGPVSITSAIVNSTTAISTLALGEPDPNFKVATGSTIALYGIR